MFNFEKLDVWQKAIDFADLVYRSHAQSSPLTNALALPTKCGGPLSRFPQTSLKEALRMFAKRFCAIYRDCDRVGL